jgi:Cytidylate kinase-like family
VEQSRVLTISATYGAGGSVVAPAAAARLQLPFFDRLLHGPDTRRAEAIMERLSDEERRHAPPGRLAATLAHLSAGLGIPVPDERDLNPREVLRRSVTASISNIVASGGGVILGRGGAVVLAGQPFAFHVRLDGPPERRLAQAMALAGIDPATAERQLRETDRAREAYVRQFYGVDARDATLYHLVIDSTVLPLDLCVDLIALAARARAG